MYSAVHNIDFLCSYWHSDPESDNSDSSDSDFEPEKEVIPIYIIIQLSYTVRIPIFWLADLYHVILCCDETTTLTSLS